MKNKKTILLIVTTILLCNSNYSVISAKEPIMQERYTLEEQRIKRAQFIWTASINELEKDNVLSENDAKNIKSYLKTLMTCRKYEAPQKKYDIQKDALKAKTIDKMVNDNIITYNQGELLRAKLNKYNITN